MLLMSNLYLIIDLYFNDKLMLDNKLMHNVTLFLIQSFASLKNKKLRLSINQLFMANNIR